MTSHTGKSVLVVEDEENLLAAIRYNLEREGYRALTATDGEEGLRKAAREDPDLLVLDVMLPVLDGFEVCRIVRRDSDVPILFLTAKDQEMDRVVGSGVGRRRLCRQTLQHEGAARACKGDAEEAQGKGRPLPTGAHSLGRPGARPVQPYLEEGRPAG